MMKSNYSWEVYHELVKKLASSITPYVTDNTEILAIARGGLIPGVLISHILDKQLYTVSTSSYKDEEQGEVKVDLSSVIFATDAFKDKHIILIDDIYDTGNTCKVISSILRRLHQNIKITVAVVVFRGSKDTADSTPDLDIIAAEYFDSTNWLVFPYEV